MYRATGLCLMCGKTVIGMARYCEDCKKIRHREANKRHYEKMRLEGCCVFCGRASNGQACCDKCKEKMKISRSGENIVEMKPCFLTRGGMSIGASYMPYRKKPCLAVRFGNTETKYASFNDEESATLFMNLLKKFVGA